ncbi:hypothetical protein [Janthinobacterium sp. RB2P8]|uniref:hypothetical protein n=1 Tax=Janthinobacterium sp. RB2P8 TaxID=3424191 RepID=UPI003F247690
MLLVNDRGEPLDTYSLYHLGPGVAGKAQVISAYHAALATGAIIVKPSRTTCLHLAGAPAWHAKWHLH